MESTVRHFDYSKNFWKEHPDLKPAFDQFYTNDKSYGKNVSSKIMWAIALVYHPKSKFYNLPLEERQSIAEKEIDLPNRFTWDRHQSEIETLRTLTLSKAYKFLDFWRKELEDRFSYLDSIKYSQDTSIDLIEHKEKMMKETKRLWDSYTQALKDVEDEEAMVRGKGGAKESLQEQKLI